MTAPAVPLGDQISRTARQVYRPDGRTTNKVVHALVGADTGQDGRLYYTGCRDVLTAAHGAVLTTRDVTCSACRSGDAVTR